MNKNAKLHGSMEWFKNQIAGRLPLVKNGVREIGFIKVLNDPCLLKPVQEGVRGEREKKFYEEIKIYGIHDKEQPGAEEKLALLKELFYFTPFYMGVENIVIDGIEKAFLQMEDLTFKFQNPCIMDVKIGRVTYDPLSDERKKHAESIKCACQRQFGFRVLGYKISSKCVEPTSRDRIWGRELDEDNIQEAFEEYLLRGWPSKSKSILTQFIEQLTKIRLWFLRQRVYHFYASSLLLIYEGQPSAAGGDSAQIFDTQNLADIRMIDFSHVFPAENKLDENYIHGINYIINVFSNILQKLHSET